ncbi:MAG: nucleotidyltransferase domain-containing protein [Parcubacteria group bacterium]|nr:nucleotidyltransferase domain-containing protein [Parcubacteria group bacterium]
MAQTTVKFPKKIINHYISTLENKIRVDSVLLFGSFAWGKPTKHSDVDLAVISKDFAKYDFDKRLSLLNHTRDKVSYQVAMDIIGYTPKEFSNIEKYSAIMSKAKQKGKWIYRKSDR